MWRIILSEVVRSVLAESPAWTVKGAVSWDFVVQMGKPRPTENEELDWRSPASGPKSPGWFLYCAEAESITPCVSLGKSLPFSEPPSLCQGNRGGKVLLN